MNAIRPVGTSSIWISPSPNDAVLTYCLDAISNHSGAAPRAICISGCSASGGSALAHQIAKRARRQGRRVLFLNDDLFPGNKYLLSKLLHSMGVGAVNCIDRFDGFTPLCRGILHLRYYDVVIIDDVQKYNTISWYLTESNLKTLLQICHLHKPPLILMMGLPDAAEFHHAKLVDAGIASELKELQPMDLDQHYTTFVYRTCKAMSWGNTFFMSLDIKRVHRDSQGRIGWTIRILEWLHLKQAADFCAQKHPVYQQLTVNDEDEYFADKTDQDVRSVDSLRHNGI